jgi:membrane-bound ClpP family serine protease
MGVNIKLPIGLMFSILGILLVIHGLLTASDTGMYDKSMDINVNLWTGLFMVVVAAVLLVSLALERQSAKKARENKTA